MYRSRTAPIRFDSHCAMDVRSNHVMRRQAVRQRVKHHAEQRLPVPHPGHLERTRQPEIRVFFRAQMREAEHTTTHKLFLTVSNSKCVSFCCSSSAFHLPCQPRCSSLTANSTYMHTQSHPFTPTFPLHQLTRFPPWQSCAASQLPPPAPPPPAPQNHAPRSSQTAAQPTAHRCQWCARQRQG